MVSLPETLLEEIDGIVSLEKGSRSELIREVMFLYLSERKRKVLREQMKQGYKEMAQINLRLALESVPVESELLWSQEKKVAE